MKCDYYEYICKYKIYIYNDLFIKKVFEFLILVVLVFCNDDIDLLLV